jgi:uncharacterized protein (DUF305 family)
MTAPRRLQYPRASVPRVAPGGRVLLGFVLALGVFAGVAAPGHAAAPAPDRNTARFEVDYMQFTTDHHAMGVRMGELCVQKATLTELRDLCRRIVEAQAREIQLLQGWLRDWYDISYQPQMKQNEMRMLERLAALSGDEFNVEISKMFIRHHFRIIVESRKAVDRAYHSELQALARNVIAVQSREIEEFRAILCRYGLCNYGPKAN